MDHQNNVSLDGIARDIHHIMKAIADIKDDLKRDRQQMAEQHEKFETKMEERLAQKADVSRVEKIENNLSWAVKIVLTAVFVAVLAGVIYTARTPNVSHAEKPAVYSQLK
nr:hypothetical protein [Brevundimonas naejangsanensis]